MAMRSKQRTRRESAAIFAAHIGGKFGGVSWVKRITSIRKLLGFGQNVRETRSVIE
jgi:hypothetical protein